MSPKKQKTEEEINGLCFPFSENTPFYTWCNKNERIR